MSLTTTLELRAIKGEFRVIGINSLVDKLYLVDDFKYLEHAESRAELEVNVDRYLNISSSSRYIVYDDKGNVVYEAKYN